MNTKIFTLTAIVMTSVIFGCSPKVINIADSKLNVVNREITSVDKTAEIVSLNDRQGDGLAILEDVEFESGTIEIELKGENTPGKSFLGLAFNIQNDSTYEAIYFRPFNFQSKEKIRREHSVQYISHPKHTWRYLRSNHEGMYESEYNRRPSPDAWFSIRVEIENEMVSVYDKDSGSKLLSTKRLVDSQSNKIGLWVGFNSKGEFRNLRVRG